MQRSCYLKIDDEVLGRHLGDEVEDTDYKVLDPEVYTEMSNTGYKRAMRN